MKFFVGLALLALCGCAFAQYTYIFPNAPCSWGVDIRSNGTGFFWHYRYYASGLYYKLERYNYVGELIEARVGRPDIFNHGDFVFSGSECHAEYNSNDFWGQTYWDFLGEKMELDKATEFPYIDDAVYNGQNCMVYYKANKTTGRPDKDTEALFVNFEGKVIGYQKDMFSLENRTCYNVTYFNFVPMSIFKLDKSYCYGAAEERLFTAPDSYFARCSASTNSVVFSVVALLVALVLVF